MPISTDLLDDDEDVLVDLRPHWVFFFAPLALTVVAVAIAAVVFHQFPKAPVAVAWILGIMIAVPAMWLAARLARWFGTSLIVTDRRIVFRSGVLGRQIVNLRLQRIVDTHCTQRPLERLMGAGRLVLEVEGEEGGLVIDDVRRPRTLQRVINRQIGSMDAGWAASSPSRAPSHDWEERLRPMPPEHTPPTGTAPVRGGGVEGYSIADQLFELDRLRRQGILSEEEFASKKEELLRRI